MMRFLPAVLAGAAALALLSGCVTDDYYDGYSGSYGGAYAGNYPYRGYGYDPYYSYGYGYGGYGYPAYDYYGTPFTTFGLGLGLGYYDYGGFPYGRGFDRRGDRRGFSGGGGVQSGGGAQSGGTPSVGGQGGARLGGRDFGGQNIAPALRGPSGAQGGRRTQGLQE